MRYLSLLLALLTPFGAAVCGCESQRGTEVLLHRPLDRSGERIRAVAGGSYRLTDGNEKELFRARHQGGDVIGIELDAGGRLVALAGPERLSLRDGRYAWRYVRPVEFGDVPKFAGEALV